jgi:hypothetical protein
MLFTAIRVKKILYPSVTAPSKKGLEYIYIYGLSQPEENKAKTNL